MSVTTRTFSLATQAIVPFDLMKELLIRYLWPASILHLLRFLRSFGYDEFRSNVHLAVMLEEITWIMLTAVKRQPRTSMLHLYSC